MPSRNDVTIIRELAKQVAEIAALPIQEEKRRLWRQAWLRAGVDSKGYQHRLLRTAAAVRVGRNRNGSRNGLEYMPGHDVLCREQAGIMQRRLTASERLEDAANASRTRLDDYHNRLWKKGGN